MYQRDRWHFAIIFATALFTIVNFSPATFALEVNIAPNLPFLDITVAGKKVRIERNQDTNNRLTNGFSKTSRVCPPFCIAPMSAGPGVATVGELELIRFLKARVEDKSGLLVDARVPSFYTKGTIPGSVNIPFTLFSPENNPYFEKILAVLGSVKRSAGQWDFSKSMPLMMFCNGPWCDQSPRAIKHLLDVGYPADRIFYYRGGMQNWQALGFNILVP